MEPSMLDIRNAKIIRYDSSLKQVTAYPGFGEDEKWYLIPEPLFSRQILDGVGIPKFTLIEYTVQSGDVMATCTFSVRLSVTPAALTAAQSELPGVEFGKLDWISTDVFATFSIAGVEYYFNAQPSLANENEATFIINLDSAELVNFFITSFGPDAPTLSPLLISYDVTSLAKLDAVEATVSFNAEKALEYEKSTQTTKNMWGSVTSRTETIRKNLKASDAGTTDIDYKITNPSDEFKLRVENWAFKTLEGLVDQATEDAVRCLGLNNTDKMSAQYVVSFSRSYKEKQTIEWVISPQNLLLANEISDNWDLHHTKSDFRKLIVNFSMLGELATAKVETVDLTVNYQDVIKSHTFTGKSQEDWTFEVDGRKKGGIFDPQFTYEFVVTLKDGQSFSSENVSTEETKISISLSDLGTIKVNFIGETLDFEKIEKVGIDFIFTTPKGAPNVKKYKEITSKDPNHTFSSDIALQAKNFEYSYRYTYYVYLNDEKTTTKRYSIAAIVNQGGKTKNSVIIPNPIQEVSYNIVVQNPDSADTAIEQDERRKIVNVNLRASYDDNINEFSDNQNIHYDAKKEPFYTFQLKTVENSNGAYVLLNGFLTLTENQMLPVSNVYLTGRNTFIPFHPDKRNFSVKFDPALVNWKAVIRVDLNAFTIRPGTPAPVLGTFPPDDRVKDYISSLTFETMPEDEDDFRPNTPAQYFNFQYDEGTQPAYYYEITYFHQGDIANSYVEEASSDISTVTLPKDATGTTPTLLSVQVDTSREPHLQKAAASNQAAANQPPSRQGS